MLYARNIMNPNVVTFSPHERLEDVGRTMLARDISGAPVCDAAGRLLGVLSKTDILSALLDERTAPRPQFVSDAMCKDVVSVAPDLPVAEIVRRMLFERIHRVIVVEAGSVIGVVTALDVMRGDAPPAEAPRAMAR